MVMRLARGQSVRGGWVDKFQPAPKSADSIDHDVMPSDASAAPAPSGQGPTPTGRAVAQASDAALQVVPPFPDQADEPDGPVAAVDGPTEMTVPGDGEAPPASATPIAPAALEVQAALEALLLSTHHPLTPARLTELLAVSSTTTIRDAVQALNDQYASSGRSFRIEQVAGGYQILTLPEFGGLLKRLHQKEGDAKLTKAALETLSIIAYKQPILRADIEAIRGVACGETIRSLMEKHLVKIDGRAEEPGRPILYGTTKRFLELFGLNSLKDLPRPEAPGDNAVAPPLISPPSVA